MLFPLGCTSTLGVHWRPVTTVQKITLSEINPEEDLVQFL